MISEEYGVNPNVGAGDVTMEKPLIEQAVELEGQAAELLARAAWLRRQASQPPPTSAATASAFPEMGLNTPARAEGSAGYNPDTPDSWERVLLH